MARRHRELMHLLIGEIAGGALASGDRLPGEVDLAGQHGVSRGVARECLRGLEERGLVEIRHGSGTRVTPEDRWDVFDPDVLSALLTGPRATPVLGEFLECRRALEIEAAGLAADRATGAHLLALADAFTRMTKAAERARLNPAAEDLYQEADIAFHRAVVAAAENRALGRVIEPIHRALQAAIRPLARPEHRFQRGLPDHRRIMSAIADRDVEGARRAMDQHFVMVEEVLRDYAAKHQRLDGGTGATLRH